MNDSKSVASPNLPAKARDFIEASLAAMLPPGVPPFHKRIIRAHFETKSTAKYRCAQALLELFDGQQAGIEVWDNGQYSGYEWLSLDGDLSYEGGQWVRVAEAA